MMAMAVSVLVIDPQWKMVASVTGSCRSRSPMPMFSRRTTAPSRMVRIAAPTMLSAAAYRRNADCTMSQLVSACAAAGGAARARATPGISREWRMHEDIANIERPSAPPKSSPMRSLVNHRCLAACVIAVLGCAPLTLPAQSAGVPNKAYSGITEPIARVLSGDKAYATTDYVQSFYRNPASRGFDASIDSVEHVLIAAGYVLQKNAGPGDRLTYRMESRPSATIVWSPLGASITLAGRSKPLEQWSTNHNMLTNNGWSTPAGGIDAEIVNVGDGSDEVLDKLDLKGKIAYSEGSAPTRGGGRGRGAAGPGLPERAAARGAVGVLLGQKLPAYNQQEKNRTAINFGARIPYDTVHRIFAINVSLAARDTLNAALARGAVRAHVVTSTVFEDR